MSMNSVGTSARRIDGIDKVTGRAVFAADMSADNMLWGEMVRAKHPHAMVNEVEISEALACPGVAKVITAADVPGDPLFGVIVPHQPVFVGCGGKVRYIGDGVALVMADTKEQASSAARLVKVDYTELPAIFDPEEALGEGAPQIHHDYPGNEVVHHRVRRGDVEAGFAKADLIMERQYSTQFIEHAYIEPEAALAMPGPGGGVDVYGSIQNPFSCRRAVARVVGLPLAKVRVIQCNMGGSFGGKDEVMSAMCARAALGVLLTGRPVKLVNSREESLVESYKRHPYGMHYRVGVTREGRLTAMEIKMIADAGGYASQSPFVTWRSTVQATGPYEVPAVSTDVRAAFTNNTYTGAMRGFGSPQAIFANESLMDEIAFELGMDPLELRRLNGYRQGSVTATGHELVEHTVSIQEVIRRAAQEAGWSEKRERYALGNQGKTIVRGIGMACSFRGCALGAEGVDAAAALVSIQTDGSVLLGSGLAENGQGLRTIFAQIASEELRIDIGRVVFMPTDTSSVPDSGPTVASRSTIMGGNAVRDAARRARQVLEAAVAEAFGVEPQQVVAGKEEFAVVGDGACGCGRRVSFEDAVGMAWNQGRLMAGFSWYAAPHVNWDERVGQGKAYFTYVYGCQIAEVAVDTCTGQVRVERMTAAHDVGKAINPQNVKGQIFGGMAMGLGYGLLEEVELKDGFTRTVNFDEYLIPTTMDVPHMVPIIVENADPYGPYGAKTIGEPTCELGAAAIANAVFHATGRRMRRLPLDMEQVLLGANLKAKRAGRGSVGS